MSTEQKLVEFIESLAAEGVDRDALGDFEADVIGRISRLRKERDRVIRDMEAAALLHEGWRGLADRYGVCKATVYKMAERGRESTRERAA